MSLLQKIRSRAHTPVSAKVSNGTLTGALSAIVVWALVTFVPAFKNGIPTDVAPLIPLAVSALGQYSGGWLSTHRATAPEVQALIADFDKLETFLHLRQPKATATQPAPASASPIPSVPVPPVPPTGKAPKTL